MAIRADKREVTKGASVVAKASWLRNPQRKALVENKKKREGNKEERRQQVKKMMKAVDKRRAGKWLEALPKNQKKKPPQKPKSISDDTVPLRRSKRPQKKAGGNLSSKRIRDIYNS